MRLPSGYKRIAYIRTTGTQFLNTRFKPNQNTRVVIDFKADNDACHIFGARTEFLNKGFLVCWVSDFVYCVQVANTNFNGGVFDTRGCHTIDMTATAFKLDGVTKATYSTDAFQADYELYLASCPNSSESENMQGDICGGRVYDGGILVRDYIPCIDPYGAVGMWENVSGTFVGNAGTGDFIAGPEYSELPAGYTPVDYIESTGTQYLNTQHAPTNNTRVVAEFQKVVSANTWVLGSRVASGNAQFDIFTETSGNGFWRIGIGSVHSNIEGVAFTDRLVADVSMDLVQIGSKSMTPTRSEFTSSLPIFLFAVNNNGSAFNLSATRFWSYKRWESGVLFQDLRPCRNPSGEAGMYDLVHGVFHGNAGTDEFVTPADGDAITPAGDHNTNMGGVSKEIESGTMLIGGVLREIDSGLVLVGGVAREIAFTKEMFTVTITKTGSYANASVVIDGTTYTSAATVEVEVGEIIHCEATSQHVLGAGIYLNDEEVARGSGGNEYGVPGITTYEYTVTGNTAIELSTGKYWGDIYIAEE